MCNCGKNKKTSNSTNTRVTSGGGNCPNKRLQLNKLRIKAESLSLNTSDESIKTSLNNLSKDIETYLENKSVCPKNEYITAVKQTIDGIIN